MDEQRIVLSVQAWLRTTPGTVTLCLDQYFQDRFHANVPGVISNIMEMLFVTTETTTKSLQERVRKQNVRERSATMDLLHVTRRFEATSGYRGGFHLMVRVNMDLVTYKTYDCTFCVLCGNYLKRIQDEPHGNQQQMRCACKHLSGTWSM